ncbi:programmed cell death protein 2 [Paramormyrops kingsleyae]|uniref:Programmed cell death 2 n=1 Tax=Paramormyrops kingsleyae TaxID=1676925 RepID=A0A3B3S4F2_9TELE|nr:programmed cell death protein 2 [Paramormyrops kingsleyae]
MAGNECGQNKSETGIVLGFVEEVEPWHLRSSQFPSKVGGKPAWLSQSDLPGGLELECEKCHLPTALLLQVYAPILGQDRSFHRAIFVFCCKTPSCYSRNDNRCFKVFRSQLARKNDFYPYDPPPDEDPKESESDALKSGIKLCGLCGCIGPKVCSRCHAVNYCSKEHQTIDWKAGHKNECAGKEQTCSDHLNTFIFPEFELVTEPEELPAKDEKLGKTPEEKQGLELHPSDDGSAMEEKELQDMAMHETEDSKVFQKFKLRTAPEPEQVLRYCRLGSPLWVSSEHIPKDKDIPKCTCGARRLFELQVMPQLLNHLHVDSPGDSIDWGTLLVYTCEDSCDHGNKYSPEFLWKQDIGGDGTD